MIKTRLWVGLCCLLYTLSGGVSFAQVPQFRLLTVDDGLSHNHVQSLLQDRRGFIWFGTVDGLNRFDGYRFRTYRKNPENPHALQDNAIWYMREDLDGHLWIITRNAGPARFDPAKDMFTTFPSPDGKNWQPIEGVCVDHWGLVWMITRKPEVLVAGPNSPLGMAPAVPDHLPNLNYYINEFTEGNEEQGYPLWISTTDGLLEMKRDGMLPNGESKLYSHDPNDPQSISHNHVRRAILGEDGGLWLGTFGGGINRFDATTGTFRHFKHEPNNPKSLPGDKVISLCFDDHGYLWAGILRYGLVRMNPQTGEVDRYNLDTPSAMTVDRQGVLWMATADGVRYSHPLWRQFMRYRRADLRKSGLSDNTIRSISGSSDGHLWLGTRYGGINEFNPLTGSYTTWEKDVDDPNSLINNHVLDSVEGAEGEIWIATALGLDRLDRKTGKISRAWDTKSTALDREKKRYRVNDIHRDENEYLWLGTHNRGLIRYHPKTKERRVYHPNEEHKLPEKRVFIIHQTEEDPDKLYLGLNYNGLLHFSKTEGALELYSNDVHNQHSISGNQIFSLHEQPRNVLWVGTSTGLNRYEMGSDQFQRYSEVDGLPNEVILGINGDGLDEIWLSTNRGLARMRLSTGEIKNFRVNGGFLGNVFSISSTYRGNDGQLFFGGRGGMTSFYPERIKRDLNKPDIHLTEFRLANKLVPIDSVHLRTPLKHSIDYIEELVLGPKENVFSIEMSGLHYTDPKEVRYYYKLEHFEDSWTETKGDDRRMTYTNLDPGEYRLRLKAISPDGIESDERELPIRVKAPLWQSLPAKIAYFIALIMLLAFVWHFKDQKKKFAYEQASGVKLRQLDKLKDEFLANTSHELRTPLNGIIGLAESLLDGAAGPLEQAVEKNLTMIAASGKRLSNLVNDILDFSKLKNHNLQLSYRKVDLYALVDVVLNLSKTMLEEKELTLINDVDRNLPLIYADEARLEQVLYNLVGNAIKFTPSGYVRISSQTGKNKVMINVEDTGIGIDEAHLESIFESFEQADGEIERAYGGTGLGLAISRMLVNLHGGQIRAISTKGKGTTMVVTLPSGRDVVETIGLAEPRHYEPELMTQEIDTAETAGTIAENAAHIFVVDDEPINRQVLRNYLSVRGYRVTDVDCGVEALKLIEEELPDVILLDVMMPRMSGYEVCRKLRETYQPQELPIIFLSARNQVSDLEAGFQAGGNDYLGKPIAREELYARLRMHLQLLDANQELRSLNQKLEEKVKERTASLEARNEDLLLAKEVMSNQDKMAALGLLTAGVAHELSNPVSFTTLGIDQLLRELEGFQGFLFEMAGDDTDEAVLDAVREQMKPLFSYSETVSEGIERIKNIARGLQTYSRREKQHTAPVDVGVALDQTINLIQVSFKHQVHFVTEFGDDLVISCRISELKQVFMNLCVNGCHAILEKLERLNLKGPLPMTITAQRVNDRLFISISDEGVGMTQEVQAKIFQTFYSTKGENGTGLGLAISQDIVKNHGGQITVVSVPEKGTTFTIELPLYYEVA